MSSHMHLVRASGRLLAVAIAAVAMLAPGAAAAADVVILAGGAAKSGLSVVIPGFEAETRHAIKAEYQPVGRLMEMLAAGATPDIVVITEDVLSSAIAKGYVRAETATEVGRVGIGVAVKAGAAVPDISTPDAFKAALLKAGSLIMINPATGTSGKHLAAVFKDLGIADALAPKLRTLDAGFVADKVAAGEVEMALHQMTELLPVPGITIAGPLPPTLQKVTVYVALVSAKAKEPAAAAAFLATLLSPAARAGLAAKGYAGK